MISMTEKQEIITEITRLLEKLATETVTVETPKEDKQPKLLTINEAIEVTGLSQGTLRQMVWQNKVPHIRAGAGKRGKILINEEALKKIMQG